MKCKSLFMFVVGAVTTLLLTMAWMKFDPPNQPKEQPPTPWLDRAQRSTMPDRREYTLPLNNPDVVAGSSAVHMEADDLVVGITVHGHSRAYPWWILSNYHVVNDTMTTNTAGNLPIYIGLCEQCSGAGAFIPTIDELPSRPLTFQISGIHAGTFEISDIQTLSQWHPFSGEALDGPLKGKKLTPIPCVLERWEGWLEKHPDTDVVLGSLQMRRRPHGMSHGASIGHPYMPDFFAQVANLNDRRLPANELVYGLVVDDDGSAVAVRLSDLKDVSFLEFEFKGVPLLVCRIGEYGVRGFVRERDGQLLRFRPHAESPLELIDQFDTVWNESGEAVGNDNEVPWRLRLARGYLTEWYEWVSYQPATEIYNPVRKPNADLRQITVYDEAGKPFSLSSLTGHANVLVFGCGTAPQLEANIAELETVYRDFRDKKVNFYLVYKTLAHPTSSGFLPPVSISERVFQARAAKAMLGTSIPWLSDNMTNELADAVSAGANSELIIDESGKILQLRGWCDPILLRADLAKLVGQVETPTSANQIELQRFRRISPAPKNVLPPIETPYGMIPIQVDPQASDLPYFVKLIAEADSQLLRTGSGKLYLGFYLDSMYGVYWNSEQPELQYEIASDTGAQAQPATGRSPSVNKPRDIDPREFLISVKGANVAPQLRVTVNYVACNDEKPFRLPVSQTYDVRLVQDRHAGTRLPRLEPEYREGDVVAKIMEFDVDGNGTIQLDEIAPNLLERYRPFDANGDGRLDADEMQRVEQQLLRAQDYQW